MAAILDFTKNSKIANIFLLELYNVIQLNILLFLVVFHLFFQQKKKVEKKKRFLIQKWLELMLLITYLCPLP